MLQRTMAHVVRMQPRTSRHLGCLGKIIESFALETLEAQRSVEELGVQLELKIRRKHGI